jgi:hypothetical protein
MFTVTGKAEEMFKLISRWSSSFAIAVTLVLGTLSSTGATRRPRPLRGEWHAEIRVVGGIS